MRQIGEQWIEDYGTVKYMAKAAKQENPECCESSCDFCCFEHFYCTKARIADCNYGKNYIVKDLGPVNEEGCLAEERTGLFPTIEEITDGIWKASVYSNEGLTQIEIEVWSTSEQGVKDAWNRRA